MEEHEADKILVRLYNTAYGCGFNNSSGNLKKSGEYYTKHMKLKEMVKKELVNTRADQPVSVEERWQPIETAPRDGSHIQLYRPEIQFAGYYAAGAGVWCVCAPGLPIVDPPPTHWMDQPMPPAPKE